MFELDALRFPIEYNLDHAPTLFNWPDTVIRDETILNNLNRMVQSAKSSECTRIWTNKRNEFVRSLRWGVLKDHPARGYSNATPQNTIRNEIVG